MIEKTIIFMPSFVLGKCDKFENWPEHRYHIR